jgi:hypothetical protein
MHAYQLLGNDVNYWLIGTTPADGAFTYSGYPLVVGYVLMAGVFLAIGYHERGRRLPAGDTLEDARVADPGNVCPE